MAATWRDPDDITPGARRTPREVAGWRSYCPLRRMSGHPNSGITAGHIMAADKLREHVDVATMGYSADRPLIFVQRMITQRYGLGPAEQARMSATREVFRVVRLFSLPQLVMLDMVVLRNTPLAKWTHRLEPPSSPRVEKRKLLVILDRLVQHFDSDVQDDLAKGRRLTP